jgi:glutathione S-transferase
MHGGFAGLRSGMSFENSLRVPPPPPGPQAAADLATVLDLFEAQRARYGADGPGLVGPFSLADCMFAPVAQRVLGFGVDLDGHPLAARYMRDLLARPSCRAWMDRARSAS